jgi:cyclopropane fatty-acyl-phospholipid synthase-like methyltransferase
MGTNASIMHIIRNWKLKINHIISYREHYAFVIGTNTPVITYKKMNNKPLQMEQTPQFYMYNKPTNAHYFDSLSVYSLFYHSYIFKCQYVIFRDLWYTAC